MIVRSHWIVLQKKRTENSEGKAAALHNAQNAAYSSCGFCATYLILFTLRRSFSVNLSNMLQLVIDGSKAAIHGPLDWVENRASKPSPLTYRFMEMLMSFVQDLFLADHGVTFRSIYDQSSTSAATHLQFTRSSVFLSYSHASLWLSHPLRYLHLPEPFTWQSTPSLFPVWLGFAVVLTWL
jgi:hypothetical protein